MQEVMAYGVIGLVIVGVYAALYFIGKRICALHRTQSKPAPSKPNSHKQQEIPWSQLSSSGKLWRLIGYLIGYWFLFYMVLAVIARSGGNQIQQDQLPAMAIAPFVLPFTWLWQLLNNKAVIYVIIVLVVVYAVGKELERLHGKLDEILARLNRL